MSLPAPCRRAARQAGITLLLELLVVVLILGLLLALVLPGWGEQLRRTKRVVAQVALQQLAARQEQFFVQHRQFSRDLRALGYGGELAFRIGEDGSEVASGGLYEISLVVNDPFHFSAQARPLGAQARDRRCGSLGLDSEGVKTITGTGSLAQCW